MQNQRNLKDALLLASIALPNAATTVVTAGIDLGNTTPGEAIVGMFTPVIKTTAATGVDAKTILVKLQDSADNSSFANIAGLTTQTITSVGTVYPATELRLSLPPTVRRYIRASATGESGGGNASDGTMELSLQF